MGTCRHQQFAIESGNQAIGQVNAIPERASVPAFLSGEKPGEWFAPGKLGDHEKADLHQGLGEVSEEIAATLVTHLVDRAVNNVRKIDRTEPLADRAH